VRFRGGESRCRVQRLVDIANDVQEPNKVIGFDVVGGRRRQCVPEELDLGLCVGYRSQLKQRPVLRERAVDEVPIFMPEMISISDILSRFRPWRRTIAASRPIVHIAGIALM
jgi:hypothetical protein